MITGTPSVNPNVTHANSGVTAGAYGAGTNLFVATTVDARGHVTAIGNVALVPPARGYKANQGGALALNGTLQVAESITVVSAVSGIYRCTITGVVQNTDSSGVAHPFTVAVGDSAVGLLYAQQTMGRVNQAVGGTDGFTTFSLVVDLDSIGSSSVVFTPIGTSATLEALVLGDNTGDMSIPINGIQFSVQEVFG